MGVANKKRVSLREKSVKRTAPAPAAAAAKAVAHVVKRTVQRRQQNVQTDPQNTENLSKSALRRHKRKLREQLVPKFADDMLDALKSSTGTVIQEKNGVESISIEPHRPVLDHTPKATNKRGQRVIAQLEKQRFQEVLKSDLAAGGLKEAILLNMKNLEKQGK